MSLNQGSIGFSNQITESTATEVFPNPSSGLMNFSCVMGFCKIEIMDLNGRVLINRNLAGEGRVEVDLTELPNGIYLAKSFSINGNVDHLRIVKQ